MRVFIYACEEMYHGLHGIEDMRVVEVESIEEANEYGMEMSGGVLESFGMEDEYEDEGAWYIGEALEWYVYPIDEEKAKGLSTEELNKIASELGNDWFVRDYCGEVI